MGIRIDRLPDTASPTLDHAVAAMAGGLTVKLTIGQIRALALTGSLPIGMKLSGRDIVTHIANIAAAKALPVSKVSAGDLIFIRGFDDENDECGGVFQVRAGSVPAALDGVAMDLTAGSYHLKRVDAEQGPICTRWCGIKPESAPDNSTFDKDGFAANNVSRWNAMAAFCGVQMAFAAVDGVIDFVRQAIFISPGTHEFAAGTTLLKPQGVPLFGAGRGVSVLRTNISSGTFIQGGSAGDATADATLYSSFDDMDGVSIVNFTPAASSGGTGLAYDNTVRATKLSRLKIFGFGKNLDINAFGIYLEDLLLQSGYLNNLHAGPNVSTIEMALCRCDDQQNSGGDNVLFESAGGARSILVRRCEIQRSSGRALRFAEAASFAVRDSFFEGNNRGGAAAPDIWIAGDVKNGVLDGNYFTGAGRVGSIDSRAINIRSDVPATARFQITNNGQEDSATEGTFASFLDIDPNVAMEVAYWNNAVDAPNVIPASVVKLGLGAGTW